jgi:hypothetical protein
MLTEPIARAEQIAKLNDRARSGFDPSARIMFTRGCLDAFCSGDTPSGLVAQAELINTIRRHRFEEDTYGERDFGAFTFRGEKVFFKIDLYDPGLVKIALNGSFC